MARYCLTNIAKPEDKNMLIACFNGGLLIYGLEIASSIDQLSAMNKLIKYSLSLSLLATSHIAVTTGAFAQDRYNKCMSLADSDASEALRTAKLWLEEEKSIPARHCEATAIRNVGLDALAGELFDGMVEDMRVGRGMPLVKGKPRPADRPMIAKILLQAGDAWLAAGENGKAYDSASRGISLYQSNEVPAFDFYMLRGDSLFQDRDYELALEDYREALVLKPQNIPLLIIMAKSQRLLDRLPQARGYIDTAFLDDPDNPELRLERGNISYFEGNMDAARSNWLWVAVNAKDTDAAHAATANLQQMDISKNTEEPVKTEP